jgi:hypothetical protein
MSSTITRASIDLDRFDFAGIEVVRSMKVPGR